MSLILPVDRLCSSYPQKLLVPIWITDKELESVASFRSWKRIPVVVYRWVLLTHCITCFDHFPFFLLFRIVHQLQMLWFISVWVYWLFNLGFQTPEERGGDRPLQPARDQLVGLEEHWWRIPGDVNRQGLSDGRRSQGYLRCSSLPTTRGSSRLLW